jgi:hypothetical protein
MDTCVPPTVVPAPAGAGVPVSVNAGGEMPQASVVRT